MLRLHARASVLVPALALAACQGPLLARSSAPSTTAAAAPTPADDRQSSTYARADIAAWREEARETLRKQAEALWSNWVFGADTDLAAAYRGREGLFSEATSRTLQSAAQGAVGEERRALNAFALYVAGEVLARETAPLDQQIDTLLHEAPVTIDGHTQPWRDLEAMLASEPDAARRRRLSEAERPLLERLSPLVKERHRRLEEASRRLGWQGRATFVAALREMEPAQLAALATRTLEATDAAWSQALAALARDQLDQEARTLVPADLPRLLRLQRQPRGFTAAALVPTASAVFRGLGLDWQRQRELTVHVSNLSTKNPRPVCLPVSAPGDVRVSVKPSPGAEFLRETLHELGHAEVFLHARRAEWELTTLGNATVSEASALTLSGLVDDPAYLRGLGTMDDAQVGRTARQAAARRLYGVRRAAARVLLETTLLTNPSADPVDTWRGLATRASGVAHTRGDAARWVLEDSPLLDAADDLRADLLAAQMERSLDRMFAGGWWKKAGAGNFLASVWSRGTLPNPDEVARIFGFGQLAPDALARLAQERLR
ncbi:MAG: hypothetical protein RL199_1326 [Pseudomonadota bacterium]|jgi:hypothetical protein